MEAARPQARTAPGFYETLIHALSELGEGVVVLEGEGFVYANEAFARLVQVPVEVLTSGSFNVRGLFHPDAREAMEERLRRRLAGEPTEDHFAGILRAADGSRVFVDIGVKQLRHDGRGQRVAVLRDTTHRHHVEEQLAHALTEAKQGEKLATLGSLVSGVAHEVRTPLAYIQNNAQILRTRLDAGAADREGMGAALTSIEEGVDRINALVKELHRYARMPAGERRSEHLEEVVQGALRLWQATHVGLGVQLVADLAPTPPVTMDAARMQQVVLNLVQNAAEAASRRGRVVVSTHADGRRVVLRVVDDGPGIAPEVMERIFEPFFTTKPDGMGLGLHIVRRVVEAHRGAIACERLPAGGTAFTVTLPVE